jgi:UDPglucose 6-dehydrogenase
LKNISVIGLGKLGAPLAAILAHRGNRVIGVDVNAEFVAQINSGKAPVYEPGLDQFIEESRARLSATSDIEAAVKQTEITFIIVPTPSDEHGGFSLRYVLNAAERIGAALKQKDSFHLVVLTSTVMPGATDREVVPALEVHSGKRCGVDFGLCYNPEFIALGSVIHDMLNPDMILIGESDARSGDILAELYPKLCDNNPPISRMNFVNAELTKLAVNTFVTTKISYANMLAQVCERLPGADADVITSALGLDSRIGRKYLKGATGYGGPCFPRDNKAFAHLARQLGTNALLAEATDQLNSQQITRLAKLVLSRLHDGGRVGILGLSYKPNTNVVEESSGLALAHYLLEQQVSLTLYDPAAMENVKRALGDRVTFATSTADCVRQCDVIVITTAWDEFRALNPSHLNQNGRPVLVDCWRILDRSQFDEFADYVALGTGPVAENRMEVTPHAAATHGSE